MIVFSRAISFGAPPAWVHTSSVSESPLPLPVCTPQPVAIRPTAAAAATALESILGLVLPTGPPEVRCDRCHMKKRFFRVMYRFFKVKTLFMTFLNGPTGG